MRRVAAWGFDAVLAGIAVAISVSVTAEVAGTGPVRVRLLALAVAHSALLLLRRRFPRAVLAWGILTGLAYTGSGLPFVRLGPAVLVAVYTVASRCDRRTSLTALGLAAAGLAAAETLRPSLADPASWGLYLGFLAAAWLLGDNVRARQAAAAAALVHAAEIERAQGERAREAVTRERLRIARELHDVVAHSMSVIALQSGTGRLVIDTRPEEAREALATIERTSRAALAEMRQLLSVLRHEGDGAPALDPAPGLGDLDALVAEVVTAGVPVQVRIEGRRRPLPAGLDLSAYRIVQEALTNVIKHARPASAAVTLRYGDAELEIEVLDDGPRRARTQQGLGTIGMRERAGLYGGTLVAGPRPEGGYQVIARLPYSEAA